MVFIHVEFIKCQISLILIRLFVCSNYPYLTSLSEPFWVPLYICMKASTKQLKFIDFSLLLSELFVSQQVYAQTYLTRNESLDTFPSLFHEIKKPQSSILNVQSGSKSKLSFSSTHLSPMAPDIEKQSM